MMNLLCFWCNSKKKPDEFNVSQWKAVDNFLIQTSPCVLANLVNEKLPPWTLGAIFKKFNYNLFGEIGYIDKLKNINLFIISTS